MLSRVMTLQDHPCLSLPFHRGLLLCPCLPAFLPSSNCFLFLFFRTLPFSVSRNPFACHSYKNNGGVVQLFPKWNIPAPVGKELS
jgi:hypothetical protein